MSGNDVLLQVCVLVKLLLTRLLGTCVAAFLVGQFVSLQPARGQAAHLTVRVITGEWQDPGVLVGVFLKVLLLDEGLAALATLVLVAGDMVALHMLPQAVDIAQREAAHGTLVLQLFLCLLLLVGDFYVSLQVLLASVGLGAVLGRADIRTFACMCSDVLSKSERPGEKHVAVLVGTNMNGHLPATRGLDSPLVLAFLTPFRNDTTSIIILRLLVFTHSIFILITCIVYVVYAVACMWFCLLHLLAVWTWSASAALDIRFIVVVVTSIV